MSEQVYTHKADQIHKYRIWDYSAKCTLVFVRKIQIEFSLHAYSYNHVLSQTRRCIALHHC